MPIPALLSGTTGANSAAQAGIKQAAIQAGASTASGLFGTMFGWINQRKQREHEQDMYEKQLADSRENWMMENEYNSPAAQMQRLKEAGLNPNLVYGNGANAMGGNINQPDMKVSDQAANMNPLIQNLTGNMGNMISNIYDLRVKGAQADLLREEALNKQFDRELISAKTEVEYLTANKIELENALGKDTYDIKLRSAMESLKNLQADNKLKETQSRSNLIGIKKAENDIRLSIQDMSRKWKETNASVEKIAQEIVNMGVQKTLMNSQINLTDSNVINTNLDSITKSIENELKDWYKDFFKNNVGIPNDGLDKLVRILIFGLGLMK